MIQKLKHMFNDEPEPEEIEIKAPFDTADGRHYERGDVVRGIIVGWDDGLVDEEPDKRQMVQSNTAPVYTSRELQYGGEYVDEAAILPTEWTRARSGKAVLIIGGGN